MFANMEDPMNGLIDKDDFEKGLAEAGCVHFYRRRVYVGARDIRHEISWLHQRSCAHEFTT